MYLTTRFFFFFPCPCRNYWLIRRQAPNWEQRARRHAPTQIYAMPASTINHPLTAKIPPLTCLLPPFSTRNMGSTDSSLSGHLLPNPQNSKCQEDGVGTKSLRKYRTLGTEILSDKKSVRMCFRIKGRKWICVYQ